MSKCVGMLTGDGWTTKIDYMRRVYSIDDVCPTIATVTGGGMELKILVKQPSNGRDYYLPICGGGCIDTTQPTSLTRRGRVQEGGTVCPTLMTGNHICRLEFDKNWQKPQEETEAIYEEENPFRIRKLTAKECWRLMDFSDKDYEKAEKVVSNTQLLKQAGNSIVVNVLVAILGQMIEGKETEYKKVDHGYFKEGT